MTRNHAAVEEATHPRNLATRRSHAPLRSHAPRNLPRNLAQENHPRNLAQESLPRRAATRSLVSSAPVTDPAAEVASDSDTEEADLTQEDPALALDLADQAQALAGHALADPALALADPAQAADQDLAALEAEEDQDQDHALAAQAHVQDLADHGQESLLEDTAEDLPAQALADLDLAEDHALVIPEDHTATRDLNPEEEEDLAADPVAEDLEVAADTTEALSADTADPEAVTTDGKRTSVTLIGTTAQSDQAAAVAQDPEATAEDTGEHLQ